MRVGIPQKGSSKASAAFHQCPILPKVGELMVNNQQYDSHDAECFIVDRSTPCFRGVGVKAQSGKEDTQTPGAFLFPVFARGLCYFGGFI